MRIAFVHPHMELGGAERQTARLTRALVRDGVEVHLILLGSGGAVLSEVDASVGVRELGVGRHMLLPLAASKLRRFLDAEDFEYVIANLNSGITAAAAAASRSPGRRWRFIAYEHSETAHHFHYLRYGRLKRTIMAVAFRQADAVLANCRFVRDQLWREFGVEALVYHPIVDSSELLQLAGHRWDAPPTRFVTVGTVNRRKGTEAIYEAVQAVESATWAVIGDGPDLARLQRRIVSDHLAHRVQLLGRRRNPYPAMRKSTLIHWARSEAFGLVMAEALALGAHVIASPTAGARELADLWRDSRLVIAPSTERRQLQGMVKRHYEPAGAPPSIPWELSAESAADRLTSILSEL